MPITSLEPTVTTVANQSGVPEALPPTAVSALWKGQTIEAIKVVRLERNIDLKEAKDVVDAYLRQQPVLKTKVEQIQADSREGLLRWAAFLLIDGAGLAYFLQQQTVERYPPRRHSSSAQFYTVQVGTVL